MVTSVCWVFSFSIIHIFITSNKCYTFNLIVTHIPTLSYNVVTWKSNHPSKCYKKNKINFLYLSLCAKYGENVCMPSCFTLKATRFQLHNRHLQLMMHSSSKTERQRSIYHQCMISFYSHFIFLWIKHGISFYGQFSCGAKVAAMKSIEECLLFISWTKLTVWKHGSDVIISLWNKLKRNKLRKHIVVLRLCWIIVKNYRQTHKMNYTLFASVIKSIFRHKSNNILK